MARSRRKPGRRCPICNKPAVAGPFCSPRCADADLAKWLGGTYRVPTDEPASGFDDSLGDGLGDGLGDAPDPSLDRNADAD